MVANVVPFADKALFVALTHVRIEFVDAEEAFPAEFAQRMYPALNLIFRDTLGSSLMHRWQMYGEDVREVQRMFVSEDLLEAYTEIAKVE